MPQMLNYQIIPGVGIGPIKLGATRSEARLAMGSDPRICRRFDLDEDHWYESCFQVHYDAASDKVEFIELAASDEFSLLYNGIDVHRTPADELVALISRETPYDPNDWELGYTYAFPKIELSLWRSIMPESGDDPDGRYFEAVGLGAPGYFSNARARHQ